MPVTNYYTVDGELLGEKTGGGSRTDYLTDALGSVMATVNPSAQVLNTYRYKPYGAQLAKTGAGADPAFRWVGTLGYRQTGKAWSDVYVRARHYDSSTGRWTSRDPGGDGGVYANLFAYVTNRPTVGADPSGLQGPTPWPPPDQWPNYPRPRFENCDDPLAGVLQQGCDCLRTLRAKDWSEINACIKDKSLGSCRETTQQQQKCARDACAPGCTRIRCEWPDKPGPNSKWCYGHHPGEVRCGISNPVFLGNPSNPCRWEVDLCAATLDQCQCLGLPPKGLPYCTLFHELFHVCLYPLSTEHYCNDVVAFCIALQCGPPKVKGR